MMKFSKRFNSGILREVGLLLAIILLTAGIQYRSGGVFLTRENLADLLTETAILGILAAGMMPVMLTGGIDLSVGAVMALAGMLGATALKNHLWLAPWVILLIGSGTGALCGVLNGFLTASLGIFPIVATLGTMYIFRGLAYLIAGGKWILQGDMSESFLSLATGKFCGVNNLMAMEIAVYLVGYLFFNYFRVGSRIYAVGSNRQSAYISGIRATGTLLFAYMITGLMAGFSGVLYVCKFAAAQGETANGYEMSVIAACVLGGVSISGGSGRIQGVFLGALFLGILNNAMPLIHVSPFYQEAIRGGIILFSIILNVLIQRRIRATALKRRRISC